MEASIQESVSRDETKLVENLTLEEKVSSMNPKHIALFTAIEKGEFDAVKKLVEEDKIPTDISDENDMSPLLQASYRGFTDIVNFLISNGADVNVTCHTNFYTPLMMASISGKAETAKILLEAGAKVTTTNSIGKTAQDLSSFVGQHEISALIRNYLTLDRLEPYYTPQGQNPARISKPIAVLLQNLVMLSCFHPVKIVITVMENEELKSVKSLKSCCTVLDDLSRKCVRNGKDVDEKLALKCHEVSSILSLCKDRLSNDKPNLGILIKMLLKENEAGIQTECERVIRDSLTKFPFTTLPVLLELVGTLSKTKVVRYCSQRCQKFHWFVHKKSCSKKS